MFFPIIQLNKIILLICFFASYGFAIGQSYQWIKTNGSQKNDDCLGIYKTNSGYATVNMFSDSFNIADKNYSVPIKSFQSFYWLFRNSDGGVRKIVKIEQDSVYKRYVKKLDNGRMFLNLDYSTFDSFYVQGKKINVRNEYPIIEIDTTGRVSVFALIPNLTKKDVFRPTLQIASQAKNIICMFKVQNRNSILLNGKIINGSDSGYCMVKFDSTGKILKSKTLKIGLIPWAFESCGNGMFRLLSIFKDPVDSFYYDNMYWKFDNKYNVFTHLVDSNLNITEFQRLPGGNYNNRSIVTFGRKNFFYNADYFIDSSNDFIYLGSNKISVIKGRQTFLVYWSGNHAKFYKHLKIYNSALTNPAQSLTFYKNKEFCAIGGQIVSPLIILPDSVIIQNPENDGNIFGLKLDTFGNLLWYFVARSEKSGDIFRDLYLDDEGALFAGSFSKTLKLNNDSFPSKGQADALLLKITDNSIIRGNVRAGPYCAGDSIFIPYRAYGKYEDTNTFFAELSDENGNFYGTPRVLGKLKAKGSGTVRGVLPLFDVLSSRNYRIRIRSNSPFVQSFMRYDSLHLLVYSKDKANPGKDTTICYGNKVKIAAKGGTLWHWSPGTAVQDSTARQTYFTGLKTTKLKITISDSSGCGKPDTAYQTITVLPPPMVQNPDTVVCANTPIQIVAKSTGGYRPGIKHYWYKDTIFLSKDTLKTILNSDTVFTLIADDGCSAVKGVASIRIQLAAKPKIANKDTTACKNLPFTLKGKTQKKSAVGVKYTWQVGNTKTQADTVKWTLDKDSSLKLIAYDLCASKSDTATLKISVFSKPNFTYSVDSICAKNGHQIKLKPSGGKAPYTFYKNNINTDSVFTVATKWQQKIVLQTIDNCQQKADSIKIELLQIPTANMQVAPNITGCVPLQLYFKTNNPKGAKVQWINAINNAQFGNLDTASFVFSQSGTNAIRIVQTNGICADSTQKTITLFPKPIADFDPNRTDYLITENQSLITNKSQGGNKFNWYWQNFSHIQFQLDTFILKFNDTGKIQVRLVAYNSYGCTDTAKKFIYVHPTPLIFFPTGITANQDGLNETFYPQGIGIKTYRLIIINRWGQDVFRGKANEAWETNEDILPGIYIYRCVYTNWQGKAFEKKGVVEVVK